MYRHILIATDGSKLAQAAVAQGLTLAKQLGAKVTAVTVTESWDALSMAALAERHVPDPIAGYEARMAASANLILANVREAAGSQGVSCQTLYVKDQHPAEGILEAASERECDLIVMASHGRRGLSRLILGSQANKVLAMSSVPVLVCR